ncbi:hypothetical protein TOPH_06359 [Tolypocladium ophioglossoides CBS 100239]|uniref:Uncharacterized protein n=1 Tax=Tolypocladium ophioglossoides (strain CBS 100239) TaxID=1163406 RepID=A0A0L0N4M0_TOLOC|nr:hypothetical protein TOPH_06359 [Tolypocladium ophioglossoides CBS 100239]
MATSESTAANPQPTASPTSSKQTDPNSDANVDLRVLIPVIVILSILAFIIFGWLGLPWHMLRRRKPRPASRKLDPVIAAELELEDGQGRSFATDYSTAFELSHMDALKVGGRDSGEHDDRDDLHGSHDALPEPPTPWDPTKPDAARLRT